MTEVHGLSLLQYMCIDEGETDSVVSADELADQRGLGRSVGCSRRHS